MRKLISVAYAAVLFVFALAVPAAGTGPAASTGHAAAAASLPPDTKNCPGDHHGVQFGTLNAWLCETKLGNDPSGGLYYTISVDTGLNNANPSGQIIWPKLHAAPGAYYASETYNDPWTSGYKRAQSRVILFDEGPAGECLVPLPSWTTDPTGCRLISQGGAVIGPLHTFTAVEEFTWDEWAANMRAGIPLEYR